MSSSQNRSKRQRDSQTPTTELNLTKAEELLISAAAQGEVCDLLAHFPDNETERVIRASVFRQLCLQQNGWTVASRGVVVKGAIFKEQLDLRYCRLDFGLEFIMCRFEKGIQMDGAKCRYLHFYAGEIFEILNAIGCEVEQSVRMISKSGCSRMVVKPPEFLGDFTAYGPVHFSSAKVGGQFSCSGGKFLGEGGWCLHAQGITVEQGVFLRDGFEARGVVAFNRAKVGGQFACDGGKFLGEGRRCLYARGITVEQSVYLRDGFEAAGTVNFVGAKIRLLCDIQGRGVRIGNLDFRYARVEGTLRFNPESIHGDIDLRDAYVREWDDRWAVDVGRYSWSWWRQRLFEWSCKRSEPPNERAKQYRLSGFTFDWRTLRQSCS